MTTPASLLHSVAALPGRRRAQGFTLVELLVVIAIIALLALICFGAADVVTKISREKKRDAMRDVLRNGVTTYRQQYFEWPLPSGATPNTDGVYIFSGVNNKRVVAMLYQDATGNKNRLPLLDESKILTEVNDQRQTLRDARNVDPREEYPAIYVSKDGERRYFTIKIDPAHEVAYVEAP